MKLAELFEDSWSKEQEKLKKEVEFVGDFLTKKLYAPPDMIQKKAPVLKVELPTGNLSRPAHFLQRAWEREITPKEIADTLIKGKKAHEKELAVIAKEENPDESLSFFDPESKILIPMMADKNQQCRKTQDGNPICLTTSGKFEPKNTLRAKTIMRKGEPDLREW